jgi:hypothetical protein
MDSRPAAPDHAFHSGCSANARGQSISAAASYGPSTRRLAAIARHTSKERRTMSVPPEELGRGKRKRQTPQEAAEEREQQRLAEQAAREARDRLRQEAAQAAALRLLAAEPVTDDNRSPLDDIAVSLHRAYNWDGHEEECVTAVTQGRGTEELTVFPQRFMTAMSTYANTHYADKRIAFMPGGGSHLHAEMYAVLYHLLLERNPAEHIGAIGVSKPICPLCATVLDHLGIKYDKRWVTATLSPHWIDPWRSLSKDCKPPVKGPFQKDDEDDGGGKRSGRGGGGGLTGGGDPIVV